MAVSVKSLKELTLVVRSVKLKIMVNLVRVNADLRRDFHPLADHMTI